MPEEQPDILKQFAEFLAAKEEHDKETAQAEDFEVEIWDEKGRGVRTRRSHAKPFLQSLGIDIDAQSDEGSSSDSADGGTKDGSKGGRQSTGKSKNATGSQSVARKYFVKSQGAGK